MRPMPPDEMLEAVDRFAVAGDLREWIIETFIDEAGELANPDHKHLADAEIGVLWTNVDNARNMRSVIGQAELMPPMAMGKWQRARAIQQVEEWFGSVPDFLLTFSAPAAATMDDTSFCALVEHELSHCGQVMDVYGMPKFNKEGCPVFAIRGHDCEEFIGVVARYGAFSPELRAMRDALNANPIMPVIDIARACGTCMAKAS